MQFHKYLIEFFKKHNLYDEEAFQYISNNTIMLNYKDPDQKKEKLGGVGYNINEEGILRGFFIMVPYVYDEITMFVSIHELTHALLEYRNIGKIRNIKDEKYKEVIPILLEKIYLKECTSPEVFKFSEELDKERANYEEYDLSFKIVPELMKSYDYDIKKTKKRIRKITKKNNI